MRQTKHYTVHSHRLTPVVVLCLLLPLLLLLLLSLLLKIWGGWCAFGFVWDSTTHSVPSVHTIPILQPQQIQTTAFNSIWLWIYSSSRSRCSSSVYTNDKQIQLTCCYLCAPNENIEYCTAAVIERMEKIQFFREGTEKPTATTDSHSVMSVERRATIDNSIWEWGRTQIHSSLNKWFVIIAFLLFC